MIDWAIVGKRVVCILEVGPEKAGYGDERYPLLNEVLTIREVLVMENIVCLRFVEIVNEEREYINGKGECCFHANRFRPVKETSIECFEQILKSVPKELEVIDNV